MEKKFFYFDHGSLKEPSTGNWQDPILEIPGDTHRWYQVFTYVYVLESDLWAVEYHSGNTEMQESGFPSVGYDSTGTVEARPVYLKQTTQTVVSVEVGELS